MTKEIIDLLKKHTYLVTFRQNDGTCTITFPEYYSNGKQAPSAVCYNKEPQDNGLGVTYISGTFTSEKILDCPIYTIRLMIIADLIRMCNTINYPIDLIYNTQTNNSLQYNDIDIPFTSMNTIEKELKLASLFREILEDFININDKKYLQHAQKLGVEDGLIAMVKVMFGGNIYE